jgi:hypothetical protein
MLEDVITASFAIAVLISGCLKNWIMKSVLLV